MTIDESTTTMKAMDVARILIRRKRYDVINFVERFEINGEIFVIKVVEDWFAPQWYSWNRPSSDSSSSSSDMDDSQEESDGFEDGEEDTSSSTAAMKNRRIRAGEENKGGAPPVDGRVSGVEIGATMMACIGNTKTTLQEYGVHDGSIPNKVNEDTTIGSSEKEGSFTNIILNTTVNGKREMVKFLNCKNVEVTVNEGEITYNPPPSLNLCIPPINDNTISEPNSPLLAKPFSPLPYNGPNPSSLNIEPNSAPLLTEPIVAANPPLVSDHSFLPFTSTPPLDSNGAPPTQERPSPMASDIRPSPFTSSMSVPTPFAPANDDTCPSPGACINVDGGPLPNLSLVVELPPLPYMSPLNLDTQPLA